MYRPPSENKEHSQHYDAVIHVGSRVTVLAGDWADLEGRVIRIGGKDNREALIRLDTQPEPIWEGLDNLRRGVRLRLPPFEVWKDKFVEALAREIIAKQHFERRDLDELEAKIRKMLDEYQKDWG